MTTTPSQDMICALELPQSCRVDQRIPKKLLLENGAPTPADKRLITDGIAEIQWIAALKPNTIGVPEHCDTLREYLEIAVLTMTVRGPVKSTNIVRLAELVHRAVPYPVLLLQVSASDILLSLAHKRWAQNEIGKVVLDGRVVSVSLPNVRVFEGIELAFMKALTLTRQPQSSLLGLYQGWIDCVQALQAARLKGNFRVAVTPEQVEARSRALADCDRLEVEIKRLRVLAAKEKQLARQVDLNLTLKRVQTELAAAYQQL